ncbi:MAG: hypothetical protein ACK500_10540 [Flavobacteriales bacterium]
MIALEKCLFTDLPVSPIVDPRDAVEYWVQVQGKKHLIRLSSYCLYWPTEEPFYVQNKELLCALLYANNWFEDETQFIKIDDLKALVASKSFPSSPSEKFEAVVSFLYEQVKEDGQIVQLPKSFQEGKLWKIMGLASSNEFMFYARMIFERGLIHASFFQTDEGYTGNLIEYCFLFEGLNFIAKLLTEGEQSKKCFIAMAFSEQTNGIREAIKRALARTGFEAIIVDESHVDSDKTINDEIIASLRKCKFCIADFTLHRNGVYFESGFALGQGKKVIYTCREDEFSKAHFDIKPLQHIIYTTEDELEKKLVAKIEAWIV